MLTAAEAGELGEYASRADQAGAATDLREHGPGGFRTLRKHRQGPGGTRYVVELNVRHSAHSAGERTLAAQLDQPTAAAQDAQQAHEDPTPCEALAFRPPDGNSWRSVHMKVLFAELSVEEAAAKDRAGTRSFLFCGQC